MTINEQSVKQKLNGRSIAKDLIEALLADYSDEDIKIGIAREFRAFADSIDPRPSPETMTDAEAKEFEASKLGFGAYRGSTFGELSQSYLSFLIAGSEQIVRYSRSDIYRDRIE